MKLLLTKQEIMNIVSEQSIEEIKSASQGRFKKWDIRETDSGEFTLEYLFDKNGNLKKELEKEE